MRNDRKLMIISLFVLTVTTLLVFYPCFSFDFLLTWDDGWQVFNDNTHDGLTIQNVGKMFSSCYMGQYSPLNQFIYTCVYESFGMRSLPFHIVNVVLHIGCVLLTFFFVKKLLVLYGESHSDKLYLIAFLTALCTAIHPLQVEPVSWISASKILSCSFFFLSGLVVYSYYISKPTVLKYVFIVLLFICSFLSKEQAIVFPLCLILIDWTIKRNMKWRSLWLEKFPFILLSFLFCLVTVISYETSISEVVDNGFYTIGQRLVFMGYSLTEYVTKLIIPFNLMYMYPFPIQPGETLSVRFYIYILTLLATFYFLWIGRKNRIFVFGFYFFVIQLILILHIVPMPRSTIVADRYLYLACIGFFFPIIYVGVNYVMEAKAYWKVMCGCFLIYLVSIGIYSNIHCRVWENSQTLKKEMNSILDVRK